ncbi:serine/threonine protein kinase [Calothrix sp. NIES-3974]|nr:serine/threonine protein kinase [Calothrix sp. NIES-3974]
MVSTPVLNLPMTNSNIDRHIGKVINNRYLIREIIGQGGMGKVYLAEDLSRGGMTVALKVLSLNLPNQQISQRFAREIFIGAQLGRKNKHIARVLSYGITQEKVPFYVMEYLEGTNLKQIIKQNPLSLSEFINITTQICLGLQSAHQGITLKGEIYPVLHRDIKPENIFITADNKNRKVVKILDFGIAKFLTERAGMTLTESFIGSLPYCSPEHMEGRKLVDVRSDIYSLGILMYEMLTGKHPFALKTNSFGNWYQAHKFQAPPNFEEISPHLTIPEELQSLVMQCLAKEVKHRPENVNIILAELEQIQKQINCEFVATIQSSIQNKSTTDNSVQLVPITSLSERICLQKTWPKNKPVALICFPHLIQTQQGAIPTLWAMLPEQEIHQLSKNISCTQFLFQQHLYPVMLWSSVLCDMNMELTRWLSYFLDLKDPKGQKIIQALATTGFYHLLLFPLEKASVCTQVITLSLTALQRQQLFDWLANNEESNPNISMQETKNLLRSQHEKQKPEIMNKLVEMNRQNQGEWRKVMGNALNKVVKILSRPIF